MAPEAAFSRLVTRDRALNLGALAVLVCLSWLYLVRASRHPHEMAAPEPATAAVAPAPPVAVEKAHAPEPEETEEDDDAPRFP